MPPRPLLLREAARGVSAAWESAKARYRERRHRAPALVAEILWLQLLLTALIGALALGGLFWTSQQALQENVQRWAAQWTAELNELGAPLYLSSDDDLILSVERFIQSYPEIDRVTYYGLDGSALFSVAAENVPEAAPPALPAAAVAALSGRAGGESPYQIDASLAAQRMFQIRGPIWTESIASDGLFAFDPAAAIKREISVAGFVGVDLDFSWYHDQLLEKVRLAGAALLALLALYGLLWRVLLKRAFAPLSALQTPIAELARGNLDVRFEPAGHREIAAIIDTLAATTEALREREARLSELANHDALTGLYNRRRFVEELTREIETVARSGRRSALVFIDLDQFKYVNDTCGHPTGDDLLKLAGEQLRRSVRENDVVGRFGGDEFSLIIRDISRQKARSLGESILEDMRRLTYVEKDSVFTLQCSIGITMINSGRFEAHELIAQADVACHEAKLRGRNRLELYRISARETEQMAADVGWMRCIREAIEHDRFLLRYQPIVHIASGETTYHEVLLRMRAPDGRLVTPDVFLPAARRFGLMADIDSWVIEHSVAQLARFRANDPRLMFTLNLSAHAFEDQTLAARLRGLFETYGQGGESLVLEISEQVAVRQLGNVDRQINALRQMGCRFAIDDFGTGYSSFSHLKRLTVDYIKIDGSFVVDLARDAIDQTMVRMIGEVGRAAGMQTIAEHVQDAAALELLAGFGIDYAQGFYVGRPAAMPVRRRLPAALGLRRDRSGSES